MSTLPCRIPPWLAASALLALSGPAMASPFVIGGISYSLSTPSETVVAPFTSPSGAPTVNPYSGLVMLTVSGTGASAGATLGDAFYTNFGSPVHDVNHYQLVVTTDATVVVNSADDAYRHIVYDVDAGVEVTPAYTPAYRPSHIYRFILDLSTQSPATPALLRFGVNDGGYGDNLGGDGAYTVQISQLSAEPVPEASTWAAGSVLGLVGMGVWIRRRRQT